MNAQQLKQFRESLGLNKAEFSRLTGISASTVSGMEKEEIEITPGRLKKIEPFLGISPADAKEKSKFKKQEFKAKIPVQRVKVDQWVEIEIDKIGYDFISKTSYRSKERMSLRIPAHELPSARKKYRKRNLIVTARSPR